MCDPISLMAGAAVVGTGASIYQGAKAAKAQKKAAAAATVQATAAAGEADRARNQANQKSPDLAGIYGANASANRFGVGSTMLTGPSGVDSSMLTLGRNTILGR